MRTRIAAGVVVASLSIVSSHAQTNYLDGWSDPPERSSEGVRPWVDAAGGSWPEPDQPPAAAAVSVVDQLAVARFLAETGIDQDDYRTAALIARRLAAEGIDPADLERLSAPPGAQGAEVKRPSAVDGMPGGAAQPKRDRTGGKER